MGEVDEFLAQLRERPMPVGLDALDGRVFEAMGKRLERRRARGALALCCLAAGLIGLVAGVAAPTVPSEHDSALFGVPAQAPSQLLGA